jgi:predicted esterase
MGLIALSAIACGGEPVTSLFEVPEQGQELESGFYALPYPNDIRIKDDGFIDLSGIPRPNELLEDYLDTIAQDQRGFGLTSALYVRFDGLIDADSLPADPAAAQAEGAAVYLVNVDADSPGFGSKLPLEFRFETEAGESIGDNWLACLPFPGFVMAEETTYALVVTKGLLSVDGEPVKASSDFRAVLSTEAPGDARLARAHQLYQPLAAYLDQPGGDERSDVVNAAVFTTQNATELMGRFRDVIYRDVPAPVAREVAIRSEPPGSVIYLGRYDSPHFQAGEFPYVTLASGGGFELDAAGDPVLQGMNDLRFSMSVPEGPPMPAAGWPVVLYAHGTGGDYRSYERDGTAVLLAEQGIASISIDQVMHGDRHTGPADSSFFNFLNPLAGRSNVIQAAIEDYQLVRLVEDFNFIDTEQGSREIRFDADKIAFFGHSQGSLTGIPFVAFEPKVKGAILSGAGGLLYLTMLFKRLPFDVPSVVELIIRDQPLDRFHPALALLQAFFEPADDIVYGRLLVEDPPEGNAAKNIFHLQGLTDRYTPVPSIEALATSIGLDIATPQLQPVPGMQLLGKEALAPPITGNAGAVTSVLVQYNELEGSDGHFVAFDIEAAKVQSAQFLKTLFDNGQATLVAP